MDRPRDDIVGKLKENAGRTDQAAIRMVARSAKSPPPGAEEVAAEALLVTAQAITGLLSQTFQAVAWNKDTLYNEEAFRTVFAEVSRLTHGFSQTSPEKIAEVLKDFPPSLLVFRLVAALTLDEISILLSVQRGIEISKDLMRDLEMGRTVGDRPRQRWVEIADPLGEVLASAVGGDLLALPEILNSTEFKTRKQRPDTINGWQSVKHMANRGVEYWVLLYQRYVGGFFRQAMDASSSIKGDILEGALTRLFAEHRIPFYRTKPREKLPNWEQAPDFLLPDEKKPSLVVEAKLAEDGGTARDKAARIERLCREAKSKGIVPIAVIDGKGFYRINDVTAPILRNTEGETYTLKTIERILDLPEIALLKGKG